VIERTNVLL